MKCHVNIHGEDLVVTYSRKGRANFSTGGIVGNCSGWAGFDNPSAKEGIVPEHLIDRLRGPIEFPSPPVLAQKNKQIESLKQARWVYLLIGALIGFAGTIMALGLTLLS